MAEENRRTLTVRLPEALYSAAIELAKRRSVSLNHLVQEGLAAVIQGEEYGRLYEAFGLVASSAAESGQQTAAAGTHDVEK